MTSLHCIPWDADCVTCNPFVVGDSVVWLREGRSRRGYGVGDLPATVAKVGWKKVQIEVPLISGGTKLVWVHTENLALHARN